MADIKISALPVAATPLAGTELVPIVQNGVTVQTTPNKLLQRAGGGQLQIAVITLQRGTGGLLPSIGLTSIDDDTGTSATFQVVGTGGFGTGQMNCIGDLHVNNKFSANNTTPQGKAAVNAAAVDPATTQALVNQLRAALIANGICV